MNLLYKNIVELCEQSGVAPARMCLDIGCSKSLVTGLKSGRTKSVTAETAQKIADYFGVSTARVLYGKEKDPAAEAAEPLSKEKTEVINYIKKMSDEDVKKVYILLSTMFPEN